MLPFSMLPFSSLMGTQPLSVVKRSHCFSIPATASTAVILSILKSPLLRSEAQIVFTELTTAGVGMSSFTATVKLLEKLSSSLESSQVKVTVPTNILESTFLLN